MSKRIVALKLDALNGNANGGYDGNFNLQLPTGSTYREIYLRLTNLDINQIERITLSLNGDEFYRVTGTLLDMIRESVGAHRQPDVLVIPFTDCSQITMESQNFSELVTLPNENLVMKIETGPRTAAQANLVANIEATVKFAPLRPAGRVRLPRLYEDGLNGTRSGEVRYSNFVNQNKNGNPMRIQRFYIMNPNCDNLKLRTNRLDIYDVSKVDNDFYLESNGQTPIAGVYQYDAVQEGYAATDALPAIGSFEMIANLSQPGDFNIAFQAVEVLRAPIQARG